MSGFFKRTFDCLMLDEVDAKLGAVEALWQDHLAGTLADDSALVPVRPVTDPGRPAKPDLVPPQDVPRRRLGSTEGRASMLHAIAHIEFTAINLALDAAWRFRGLPGDYYRDWLQVAREEVQHFILLREQLRQQGYDYGAFPAHGGLWDMARISEHDLLARMALLPRLMEAHGLDVTPGIMAKFRALSDAGAVVVLERILADEVGHVALGDRWFRRLCAERGLPAEATFRRLLADHGLPLPRGPLNREARLRAGFTEEELAGFSLGTTSVG